MYVNFSCFQKGKVIKYPSSPQSCIITSDRVEERDSFPLMIFSPAYRRTLETGVSVTDDVMM